MKSDFTRKLLEWNQFGNIRPMPWKGETDPYKIWLSEIILQQTRVEQGLYYYQSFLTRFPTIQDLANAPEDQVFKLWEGLGYYTRCKNLIATAKIIAFDLKGKFPDNYDSIRELKGVGPYTAAAIASFAFNLPFAVVDGNVQRVISRYFGINTPVDTSAGKKLYQQLAESLLDHDHPGLFNQAIMDFGATICKPQNPLCSICIQREECQAFNHGWVNSLPVKEKSIVKKTRWFTYYIVEWDGHLYIRKRKGKDIWGNLFEFILSESLDPLQQKQTSTVNEISKVLNTAAFSLNSISPMFKQQLTHQTVYGQFISLQVENALSISDYDLVRKDHLSEFAFPKLINSYLDQELI